MIPLVMKREELPLYVITHNALKKSQVKVLDRFVLPDFDYF